MKATVTLSSPRETAQVNLIEHGMVLEALVGTPLEAYIKTAQAETPNLVDAPVIAAIVDKQLRELTYKVTRDVDVRLLTMRDSDAMRIYRRSLVFLLVAAVYELFPGCRVVVEHALPNNGFYCRLIGCPPFTDEQLAQLEAHMRAIVEADEPIGKVQAPLAEAKAYFEARGDDDKLRLLENREKDYLVLYTLRGQRDYYFGYMAPSTGYLRTFGLYSSPGGFVLRYPNREEPNVIHPGGESPKLSAVFKEAEEWLALLGVQDIGQLNQATENGRARELILVAEALHEQRIAQIAGEIARRRQEQGVNLVLIAGPSSSGKTTFSKRLAVQLLAHGLKPYPLALDNYFVDRDQTPRDEHGEFDFEALGTVNLTLFNEQLIDLMAGAEVRLPHFNFYTGMSEPGRLVRLSPEHIILAEGIHGMNPDLVPGVPPERTYRIYVSALTQLNIDRHNRVPTTDVRLIRRIVRDARSRGYSASDTIGRWPSVRRGEKRWIFPYQENADVMFNSALVYELSVLRSLAEPLLLQVEPNTPMHIEAKRLLAFLGWVSPLDDHLIPDNSLLREFVGGSILSDYVPGEGRR
ncbi:MAG: nucleoside kinase [Anaerolineae bacterium]|nr:nucleoside kinase [Anaerolineae bacterium]